MNTEIIQKHAGLQRQLSELSAANAKLKLKLEEQVRTIGVLEGKNQILSEMVFGNPSSGRREIPNVIHNPAHHIVPLPTPIQTPSPSITPFEAASNSPCRPLQISRFLPPRLQEPPSKPMEPTNNQPISQHQQTQPPFVTNQKKDFSVATSPKNNKHITVELAATPREPRDITNLTSSNSKHCNIASEQQQQQPSIPLISPHHVDENCNMQLDDDIRNSSPKRSKKSKRRTKRVEQKPQLQEEKEVLGQDLENEVMARRSLRDRAPKSYTEPSLHSKLRRGDKHTFGIDPSNITQIYKRV